MANKVPIRADLDGSSLTGLAIFSSGETVGVAHGGTGATSLTDNGILVGNAAGVVQATDALTTNGQIVIGGTSGPAVANIGGTTNEVDITNGDGIVTIGLPSTVCVTTKVVSPALCIGSQYALPGADGSAGQLMCTNGNGALAFASAVTPSGVDDIKGYISGGTLKWEVASGTTWSFGWWQSSNGQWWLLGNTAEVDTFTRAEAEFYIPTGDINDVPSS
jgi:hypothetical protein